MEDQTFYFHLMKQKLFNPVMTKVNNEKYVTLPRKFLKLYATKKFNICNFNPLPSAASFLDTIVLKERRYLVLLNEDGTLHIMNMEQDTFELLNIKICLKHDEEFKITGLNSISFQNEPYLLFQHINQLSVIKLLNMREYKKIYSYSVSNYILDAKLNNHDQSVLYFGFIEANKLLIKNMETNMTIFEHANNANGIVSFICLNFISKSRVLLMDSTSVKFIDYRNGEIITRIVPEIPKCNFLCTMKNINEFNFVVVSRHSLLEFDLRSMKYNYFSHGLLKIPALLDICVKGDNVYLCLASKGADDIVVFNGHLTSNPVFSRIPYIGANIKTFLKKQFLSNPTLLLSNSNKKVNTFTTTGIKIVETCDQPFLYQYTNHGDLFRQKLDCTCPYINMYNKVINKSYRNKYEFSSSQIHNKLKLTNVADLSCAKFLLNNMIRSENLVDLYTANLKKMKFLNKEIPLYIDKNINNNELVNNFNLIWENNDLESTRDKDNLSMPAVRFDEKVRSWIHSMDFENDIDKLES